MSAHAQSCSWIGPKCSHRCLAPQPRTAQQEVGFWHGAAPTLVKQRCLEPGSTYRPLTGSDITQGGQGASAASYYGMYLSPKGR